MISLKQAMLSCILLLAMVSSLGQTETVVASPARRWCSSSRQGRVEALQLGEEQEEEAVVDYLVDQEKVVVDGEQGHGAHTEDSCEGHEGHVETHRRHLD